MDLVAEGAHLHFTRWLFQCKNVRSAVPLSDLAKEVGMSLMLRAHVVVLVTMSDFSVEVRRYATELMSSSQLQVVLVNGALVNEYVRGGPGKLRDHFHTEAGETMSLKRTQLSQAESEV